MSFCRNLNSLYNHKNKKKKNASKELSPDKVYSNILEKIYKKTFLTILPFFSRKKKASLTLEASLVVPLFLFVAFNLMYVANFFYKDSIRMTTMTEKAKNAAVYMYALKQGIGEEILGQTGISKPSDTTFWDDNIDLYKVSFEKPFFVPFGFGEYITLNRATAHMWTGYQISGNENSEAQEVVYVYVTKSGTKYHTNPNCRHINKVIKSVNVEDIGVVKNSSKQAYRECDKCDKEETGTKYYVTEGGEKYHRSISCSAIKRIVWTITLDEAIEEQKTKCAECP